MSSKSRGRHRLDQPEVEPGEAESRAKVKDVLEAFEGANTPAGLRKLVGLVMKDKADQKEAAATPPEPPPDAPRVEPLGLRPPSPYEQATITGLSGKHLYQGTVEPWRVAARRQRNKAARKARRRQRQAARR